MPIWTLQGGFILSRTSYSNCVAGVTDGHYWIQRNIKSFLSSRSAGIGKHCVSTTLSIESECMSIAFLFIWSHLLRYKSTNEKRGVRSNIDERLHDAAFARMIRFYSKEIESRWTRTSDWDSQSRISLEARLTARRMFDVLLVLRNMAFLDVNRRLFKMDWKNNDIFFLFSSDTQTQARLHLSCWSEI